MKNITVKTVAGIERLPNMEIVDAKTDKLLILKDKTGDIIAYSLFNVIYFTIEEATDETN